MANKKESPDLGGGIAWTELEIGLKVSKVSPKNNIKVLSFIIWIYNKLTAKCPTDGSYSKVCVYLLSVLTFICLELTNFSRFGRSILVSFHILAAV